MADVLKLYGDLAAGALALTWAVLVVLDGRLGKALGKIVAYQAAALFGLAALSRWYASFVGAALFMLSLGCAHLSVADGVTTADAAIGGVAGVVDTIDTDEARRAKELLAEIDDALELLRALAPALDAEIAARKAEVQ